MDRMVNCADYTSVYASKIKFVSALTLQWQVKYISELPWLQMCYYSATSIKCLGIGCVLGLRYNVNGGNPIEA